MITDSQVAPSVIYHETQGQPTEESSDTLDGKSSPTKTATEDPADKQQITPSEKESSSSATDFFQSRTINKAVVNKAKKKFVPPFLSGNLLKKSNVEVIQSSAKKVKIMSEKVKSVSTDVSKPTQKSKIASKISKSEIEDTQPQPSTSGINKKGKALAILSEESEGSSGEEDIGEEEKCCVCKKWEPDEMRGSDYISFVTWGKCDFCSHWTHLKTCTEVRVLRRDSVFRCPHCPSPIL